MTIQEAAVQLLTEKFGDDWHLQATVGYNAAGRIIHVYVYGELGDIVLPKTYKTFVVMSHENTRKNCA